MKVLFLTHRLPFRQDRGDRIRAFHALKTLTQHTQVELVSLVHDAMEASDAPRLASALNIQVTALPVSSHRNRVAAVAALGGDRPLTHVLLNSPAMAATLRRLVAERPPDVVLAYCSSMAQFACRAPLDRFPLVVDFVDVDSCKWDALAITGKIPMRWIYRREARLLGNFERIASRRAAASLVVNDREAEALRAIEPGAAIQVLPNGIDLTAYTPPPIPVEGPDVVFVGVMNYRPNVDGATWFARHVWPEVRRLVPKATFTIVGSDPPQEIRRLQSAESGIVVTGRVDDVRPYLWNAAVAIAPLHVARGVQNKVLQAVAAGLPAVVTPPVFDGLPNEVRVACRLGPDAGEFARQTVRLLRMSAAERRLFAARADCSALSWDRQLEPLVRTLYQATNNATTVSPRNRMVG